MVPSSTSTSTSAVSPALPVDVRIASGAALLAEQTTIEFMAEETFQKLMSKALGNGEMMMLGGREGTRVSPV